MDGKPWKWCKKCGLWRTGEKAHTTSEHVNRSDTQDQNSGQSSLAQSNQSIETSGLRMNPNLFLGRNHLNMKGGLFAANRGDSRDREDPNQDILDASYNELEQLRCRPCIEDGKDSVLTEDSGWKGSTREDKMGASYDELEQLRCMPCLEEDIQEDQLQV